jgi:hypothetical protein
MRTIGWPLCSYSLGRRKRRSRGAADSTKESIGRNDFLLHQSSMRRGFLRSLLPHPSGRTKVRLNLMTRKTPCSHHRRREAAINQRSARRLALAPFLDRPFLMLAREPCSARLRRVSSIPTARLTLKSTVCGLNGLLPSAKADSALHLNPRPSSQGRTLLRLRLFAPCSNENSRFRFGKKNCASLTFSLLNGIQRFRERREEKRPHGSAETATAI